MSGSGGAGPGSTSDVGNEKLPDTTVRVHRSPRVFRFLLAGAIVGVVLALVLTLAFPSNAEFAPSQVFGFLLLLCVTGAAAAAGVVALLIDRVLSRRAKTVDMQRVREHDDP